MLKLNFKLAIVTLTVALFAVSCEKETEMATNERTQKMSQVEKNILNFRDLMKNPDKTDVTFSVDSAVWYIEAALNYTKCRLTEEQASSGVGESVINTEVATSVTAGDGDVRLTVRDMTKLFLEFSNRLETGLGEKDASTNFYTVADVEIEDGKFKMTSQMFVEDENPQLWDITGSWQWGLNLGACLDDTQGEDATYQIRRWIRNNTLPIAGVAYLDVYYDREYGSFGTASLNYVNIVTCHPTPGVPSIDVFNHKIEGSDNVLAFLQNDARYCLDESMCNYYAIETQKALDYIDTHHLFNLTNPSINRTIVKYELLSSINTAEGFANVEFGHHIKVWGGNPTRFYGNW